MGMMDNFRRAFVSEDTDSDDQLVANTETDAAGAAVDAWIDRGGHNIKHKVIPEGVEFKQDHYILNDTFCRVLYLRDWPTEVWPNWLRDIYQFHRAVDVSVFYQPLPLDKVLTKLKDKSGKESAELAIDEAEGRSIDFERRHRLETALGLQNMLQRGETKMFQVSVLIQVRASSLRELNDLTAQIEKRIEGISASTRRARRRQQDGMLSMMPFGHNRLSDGLASRNMHTQAAEFTFPLANAELTHLRGIWYGVNQSTNSNVILDRFSLKDPHSVVFGQTGSGKSVAMKLEMLRALMHRMPVTVIDPDAECRRLCAAVGGQFITISPNSEDRINVLDFSHSADGQDDYITEKIWSVAKLISTMMNPSGDGQGMNARQFEIVEALLRSLYAAYGYTQDPRTQMPVSMGGRVCSENMPILSDLRAELESYKRANEQYPHVQELVQDVISAMAPYCSGGALAGLFDQRTTVNLDHQFVVFNIQALSKSGNDHLIALGLHNVLEFIWTTMMHRRQKESGIKRLLFVDEAHVMMRDQASAAFLQDIMKRARKCGVGVTIGTQSPEDFLRPDRPQGKAILENSSMQIVLNMKLQALQLLQQLFNLADEEVRLLSTQPAGVGMIFAENDRAWISMHTASAREYELVTTRFDEVAALHARDQQALEQQVQSSATGAPEHLALPPSGQTPPPPAPGQGPSTRRAPRPLGDPSADGQQPAAPGAPQPAYDEQSIPGNPKIPGAPRIPGAGPSGQTPFGGSDDTGFRTR